MTETTGRAPWWRDAVIYQIYPRSWADADGDGVGDLPGITAHLDHLADLGVDAVWLSPFYTSPQHDAGYDVADYRDVDPLFGDLAAADALIARAHEFGLRVIVDIVPNHSSSEHPWFRAALAAAPGSPERGRYLFRDGRGADGAEPPNNWQSLFGGPAWERIAEPDGTPGQWYLHLFDRSQPDFDWTDPAVGDEMESVLRFWLDRGVDGFRIDVAHGLVKAPGLPDQDPVPADPGSPMPMWDQDPVHDIYRRWRRVVTEHPGDRVLCGEAWVSPLDRLARYVRPDELHQTFNFDYLMTPWVASAQRATITRSLEQMAAVGAPATWVLSNHDVVRHASRLGYPQDAGSGALPGIGPRDPQPDAELGLRRARAATAVMLALPGSAYLYQGEELGLPEATELPDDVRQDPTFHRTGGGLPGRDGCRVPVPWRSDAPGFGFGPSGRTWLPQPPGYGDLAPDRQRGVPGSTLELYRALLRLRRELGLGRGRLVWTDDDSETLLGFDLTTPAGSTIGVLANLGDRAVVVPAGAEVLVATDVLPASGLLPRDVAVWFRRG
ncbi:glycoside hydrolase family 13 protein [Nocardioides sambongensis]|uniref:glycoside hydrolase family 13 protein n=1 Tax=Nocardioides sambongensis TaxID=2589074 RepID=UPI00112D2B6D|nr:glycoside hydrolase family 13 protein [Nocardioides sambongensis]